MSEDLERRLERIEKLLRQVVERLERLERIVESSSDARVAMEVAKLVTALALSPAQAALAVTRILDTLKNRAARDEVSMAVIEALSSCEPMTITELERRVRALRGRASKHSIRKRLENLMKTGIVAEITSGSRKLYMLRKCEEASHQR